MLEQQAENYKRRQGKQTNFRMNSLRKNCSTLAETSRVNQRVNFE